MLQQRPIILRRGLSLLEMVASLAAMSVLLVAMGSAVVVASRGVGTGSSTPARTATAAEAAARLGAELQLAVSVTHRDANGITFTVPDVRGQLIEAAIADGRHDRDEARLLAAAAVEHGLSAIATDPDWRTTYVNDTPQPAVPLGGGSCSWKLVDEDGHLDDDPVDRVRVVGTGIVGDAVQRMSVEHSAVAEPLEVLRTTFAASGDLSVRYTTVTTTGGPVSTNKALTMTDATIDGDVETLFRTGGTVTGTLTEPAGAKAMPSPAIFDTLAARATAISYMSWVDAPLLSASGNPFGATSPEGIYHIVVPPGGFLRVRIGRIKATLLIDVEPTGRFKIDSNSIIEPADPTLPTLLVRANDGDVDIGLSTGTVSEATYGVNLNPPGTPFEGSSDEAVDDVYPSELRGIVHVMTTGGSNVTIGSMVVRGTVIVDADARLSGATLIHDPELFTSPPEGYASPGSGVDPSSWRQETSP